MGKVLHISQVPKYLEQKVKELEREDLKLQAQLWGLVSNMDRFLIRVAMLYLPDGAPKLWKGESEFELKGVGSVPKSIILETLAEALEEIFEQLEEEPFKEAVEGFIKALRRDAELFESINQN